jgi:hypothetical protein
VGQLRRKADLAQEPLRPQGGGNLGAQHLQGDRPIVLEVMGVVHRRHPATTELPVNPVLTCQRSLQTFEQPVHATLLAPSRCRYRRFCLPPNT